MSTESYHALIDQICAKCNIPNPHLMYKAANLRVNDTNFSLFHEGVIDPLAAVVYGDFGPLPKESREIVLLRLLETNMYLFGKNSPAFTFNSDNGHVLLMLRISLEDVTADSVLEALAAVADTAADWRKDFFLRDDERETGNLASRSAGKSTADRMVARLAGHAAIAGKDK